MPSILKRITAICTMMVLCACAGRVRYETIEGFAQGGTYSIKYRPAASTAPRKEIAHAVDSLLNEIDFSLSGYNRNSLLSRYNAGDSIVQDRHFKEILRLSRQFSDMTEGAFDPASAPLFDIWGFGFTSDSMPSPDRVREALLRCKEGSTLNFNAIAQGYTCDVIAGHLHSQGVSDMLVNIGEIFCEGVNPYGKPWSIGIDNPVDGNDSPGADMRGVWESDGRACGIVTSGNYRKFYIRDGKKYSHTIDPRTGYPVRHDLLSATIVAPTAAEADALATACMVFGKEKAKEYILSHDGIEGFLISSESTWKSPGFTMDR